MAQSPQRRAVWRSERLNAGDRALALSLAMLDPSATIDSKLPLGREPPAGSPDWAHRCHVQPSRLVPARDHPLRLHTLGLPRPKTVDGWPMPFAGKDPNDPCATERTLEVSCVRERRCQVCGLPIAPGESFAVRRPGHQHRGAGTDQVPWVEGRAALHFKCLRFSLGYCPELIRQVQQGVARVVREPSTGDYRVLDGTMLDTRRHDEFIEPVWPLEVVRDAGAGRQYASARLESAAAINARATGALFPRLAGRFSR